MGPRRVCVSLYLLHHLSTSWMPLVEQLSSAMFFHYVVHALEPADHGLWLKYDPPVSCGYQVSGTVVSNGKLTNTAVLGNGFTP